MPPMIKSLLRLLGSGAQRPVPQSHSNTPAAMAGPATPVQAGVPIYPPVDNGISYGKADAVVATQHEMLKRLRLLSGLPAPDFERLYGGVLRSLARYVDLLPASESGTHMGAGGLFRLALEIGFFSRQAAEAVLFAGRAGVELRRDLEPRWRYATFLAGLCCELHRPLGRMIVLTDKGEEWPIHRMALAEWLESVGATRYYVRWVKDGDAFAGGIATVLATKIIPESAMQYLQEGHPNIIPSMLDAIVSEVAKSKDNQIFDIVARMRRKVIERDQVLAPQNYGKLTVGSQLEPHLVDAMRQLVADGTWTINIKKARLWYGKDGLFIVWRTAAKEIADRLQRGAVTGIPRDATTIAEVLLRAGILAADKSGDLYWKIKTPLSENEHIAVRLAKPETLLVAIEDDAPGPLEIQLSSGSAVAPAVVPVPPAATQVAPAQPSTKAGAAHAPDRVGEEPQPQQQEQPEHSKSDVPQEKSPAKDGASRAPGGHKSAPNKPLPEELQPGAITPVPEARAKGLPEDVASRMTPLVREVVAQLVMDVRSGRIADFVNLSEDGLAIALEQMTAYGVEVTKLMAELHGLGWLYVDPANPKKKIHMAQIGGKPVQSAIFKPQVVQDLGFSG